MFFSLMTPDPAHLRDAAHQQAYGSGAAASDAYADHQWIWNLFPAPAGTPRDFLFRRDVQAGLPRYYVVSQRGPVAQDHAWRVQTQPFAPLLQAGMRLRFDLRANPTVAGVNAQGKHARHDVVSQAKTKLLRERGLLLWKDWQGEDKPAQQDMIFKTCSAGLEAQAKRHGFGFIAGKSERASAIRMMEASGFSADALSLARLSLAQLSRDRRYSGMAMSLIRRPSTPSAILPCFSARASAPNTSSRQPWRQGISGAASDAKRSMSSPLATSRGAT